MNQVHTMIKLLLMFGLWRLGIGTQTKLPPAAHTMFPRGFIFGSATASYQIEGGWNADGKGLNIWDKITHEQPAFIADKGNGDIADDSYHRYKEDVQLLKHVGFQMYRFSISWARILPNGTVDHINQAGINYYMNLIDELLANGIQPMVTLYHWDLPQALQDIGGWLNPAIADIFAQYADLIFKTYGNKVKWWNTINEAYSVTTGYGDDKLAPALKLHGVGDYISAHNMLRAHGKAYRLYQRKYSHQQGKLSMAFNGWICAPLTDSPEDIAAAERCFTFTYGWFSHPIFVGDYPPEMRRMIDRNSRAEGRNVSRLPYFTQEEINEIKGSADYYGLNHYTMRLARHGVDGENPSLQRDGEYIFSVDPSWPSSAASWLKVVPQSIRMNVNKVKNLYGNPLIVITENGYGDDGSTPTDDPQRIFYYESNLAELRQAIYTDKCKVIAHFSWSILDNFEWRDGYTVKFGLVSVDMNSPNRTRTLKRSAHWLKNYIDMHSIYYQD